jgi:hypothetical protein
MSMMETLEIISRDPIEINALKARNLLARNSTNPFAKS